MKPRQFVNALQKMGFAVQRTKGSHYRLKHPDGRSMIVAFHRKELAPHVVGKMLKELAISEEELRRHL